MIGLEELYRAHFQDVFLYLCRLSGDEQLAQDLTGDTFYRAFRSVDSFRDECDVRIWLLRIAKNCYYTHCRKDRHKAASMTVTEDLPDPTSPIEEELVQKEQAERIRRHLHELTEPYKEVFMWRVFGDLSFREIGAMFGRSENWACVTYHRAAKMIRARLEGEP